MERRNHPRAQLDTPYFAELALEGGGHITVMLVDVSRGGLQLAISLGNLEPGELLGLNVTLRNLPKVLDPEGGGISGKITWLAPQRCGVRFTELLMLPDEQLASIAEEF